jgi:hypothetical protein
LGIIWDLGFGIWNLAKAGIISGNKDVAKTSLVKKKAPSISGSPEGEVDPG